METPREKIAWKSSYRETSEALETIRLQQLAAMTESEALRQIQSLGTVGTPWRESETWSGLVEQQAIFHRRRTR
jgi:hypothetical protein